MSYLTEVLADSPVHFWRLADPGGAVANDIGSARPSMLINQYGGGGLDPSGFSQGYSGPVLGGGSAVFNTLSLRGPLGTFTTPCTFEAWVWLVTSGTRCFVFGCGDGANEHGISIETNGNAEIYGLTPGGNPHGGNVTENQWHHLVATTNETTGIIYLDGVNVASSAADHRAHGSNRFTISGDPNSTNNGSMLGAIAECAFYSTALSSARVSAHYAAADNLGQPPVWSAAGLGGGSVAINAAYLGGLQTVIGGTTRNFQNTP